MLGYCNYASSEDPMSGQYSYFGTGQPRRALSFMDVFEFSADDLAANRSGTATDKQLALPFVSIYWIIDRP